MADSIVGLVTRAARLRVLKCRWFVRFCRRRRSFQIFRIFRSTVLMLIGSRPHDTFFVVSRTV